MMKKIMNWVLATTLICGVSVLNSCKDTKPQQDNDSAMVV